MWHRNNKKSAYQILIVDIFVGYTAAITSIFLDRAAKGTRLFLSGENVPLFIYCYDNEFKQHFLYGKLAK